MNPHIGICVASEAGLTQREPPKPVHNPHLQVTHKDADVLSRYHWNVALKHECWLKYCILHLIAPDENAKWNCECRGPQPGNNSVVTVIGLVSQGPCWVSRMLSNHKHLEGLSSVFVCVLAEPWHQIILTRNFNEGLARHQMSGARRVAWVTFKQRCGVRIKRTRQPPLTFSFALSDFNECVFFRFFPRPIRYHQYVFWLISIKRCP